MKFIHLESKSDGDWNNVDNQENGFKSLNDYIFGSVELPINFKVFRIFRDKV